MLELKQPPNSLEAEQSLLGALLLDNAAFERVSWLSSNAFYQGRHRRLWVAIARLIEAGRAADIVTVAEALGWDLEKAGGAAYLGEIAQNTPSAVNIENYARLVYEKSVQRQLAQVGTEIAEAALGPAVRDVGSLLDEAESKILAVSESTARRGQGPQDLKPLLARVLERVDEMYHRDNVSAVTGVPTGFVDSDHKTAGMQPGDLIIVAGRPSMGKTSLALNVAEHVALQCLLPVVVFSMEMSGQQLATRLLGSVARIDHHKMRTGKLTDNEWHDLSAAMSTLHEAPITIDESGALTSLDLRARARREWRKNSGKLGLVVVDYLQLMTGSTKNEHRAGEVAEITRSLKAMAKELGCPVMALSQLNRAVDGRPDRRPAMSDLRESGAIEQDADLILFIYREEVYHPDEQEVKGVAEVIIGKQRNGPIGMVPLTFIAHLTRFTNYASPDGQPFKRWRPTRAPSKSGGLYDVKSAAAGDNG
jgi:replicative DNA helicase